MTRHDYPTPAFLHEAERKLTEVGKGLIAQKSDLDEREKEIARKELIAKLQTIVVPAQTPAPTRTQLPPPKPRVRYVRDGGMEEWAKGRWIERDAAYWNAQARGIGSQIVEVYDLPTMPTVIDNATYGVVVVRGCMVCGHRDVVRPKSPIKFGPWRGSFCIEHHQRWEASTITDRKRPALFTTRALRARGLIDPAVPMVTVIEHSHDYRQEVPNIINPWKPFSWAYRVLKSEQPETQEPMSQPFGFLSGPIRVAVEEVT